MFIAAFRVRQLQPGAGNAQLLRARGEALLRGVQPGAVLAALRPLRRGHPRQVRHGARPELPPGVLLLLRLRKPLRGRRLPREGQQGSLSGETKSRELNEGIDRSRQYFHQHVPCVQAGFSPSPRTQ